MRITMAPQKKGLPLIMKYKDLEILKKESLIASACEINKNNQQQI